MTRITPERLATCAGMVEAARASDGGLGRWPLAVRDLLTALDEATATVATYRESARLAEVEREEMREWIRRREAEATEAAAALDEVTAERDALEDECEVRRDRTKRVEAERDGWERGMDAADDPDAGPYRPTPAEVIRRARERGER